MKIAMFFPSQDNGISTYTERLLVAIKHVAPEVLVKRVLLEKVFLIQWNPKKFFYARYLFKKLGEQMNNADIAHIQHDYSLFCLWTNPLENMYSLFRKQIHIPVVLTMHEILEENFAEGGNVKTRIKYGLKKIWFFVFSKYLDNVRRGMFEDCAAVIVHTKQSKDTLVERGVLSDKIHIIEHGVVKGERSNYLKDADKKYFGVEGKTVLMTYGYISERKGQDRVISILPNLPASVIYIIGGLPGKFPQYVEDLKEKIVKLHLVDRVVFLGFVPERNVPRLMNATDIVISPARSVTASGSLLEAIGYHKAIIASNTAFVKEINEHIPCIESFATAKELEKKILLLLAEKERMKELEKNTASYQKRYSYEEAAKKTITLYEDILSR